MKRHFFPVSSALASLAMLPLAAQQQGVPGIDILPDRLPAGNLDSSFNFDLQLVPAVPESLQIEHDGKIEYEPTTETIRYSSANIVKVRTNEGAELFAKEAILDLRNKELRLTGDVTIYQGPTLTRAKSAIYRWETKELTSNEVRIGAEPFFLKTDVLETEMMGNTPVLVARNIGVTTEDEQDPGLWMNAQKARIYPNGNVVFNHLTVEANEVPIFYFPYFTQNIDPELGFRFSPGARSNWGAFLLTRYGIPLGGKRDPDTGAISNPDYTLQLLMDARSRRGFGTGFEIHDRSIDYDSGLGWLRFYYANDTDPSLRRSSIPRGKVNEDRFRLDVEHRLALSALDDLSTNKSDWALDFNLTYLSDNFVLEDFFPDIYGDDPAPDNTIALSRHREDSVLTLMTRLQINDFYQTDTRLPELSYDHIRRPIFGTRLLHEGQTSISQMSEEFTDMRLAELRAERAALAPGDPRITQLDQLLQPYSFNRFHTYQELSYPMQFGGWLSLVPRVGGAYTSYDSVDGPALDQDRTLMSSALDASFKLSRSYPNVHNRALGLNGLVHIIQPYSSLSTVSTNELDPSFPAIDRLVPTTRPRPIQVGRYSAIDEIRDWQIARFGIRNIFVTSRDQTTHRWLTWDTYVDSFIEDPEFDRNFSNLYNEVQWAPLPWARFAIDAQLPFMEDNADYTEFNTAANFLPNKNVELTLGHRYLEGHPILPDSNQVVFNVFTRINDYWGFGIYHRWELDDSTLEMQRYTINHDFGNWNMWVGGFQRDNRGQDEYGLLLGFTLKSLPSVNLPISVDTP